MSPDCQKPLEYQSLLGIYAVYLRQGTVLEMTLQELIYTSLSYPATEQGDVKRILASSEKNNVAANITGLLLYDGERYIQILEGDPASVDTLFETISEDPRHHHLELLHKGPIEARAFQEWRMAYEELPVGLLAKLAENMAVLSMEMDDEFEDGDSFGARLKGMFMEAMAAE